MGPGAAAFGRLGAPCCAVEERFDELALSRECGAEDAVGFFDRRANGKARLQFGITSFALGGFCIVEVIARIETFAQGAFFIEW